MVQKEFQKVEKEIKDLEREKEAIEKQFADGIIADGDIAKKAADLEVLLKKIEEKTERWFELSAKMGS